MSQTLQAALDLVRQGRPGEALPRLQGLLTQQPDHGEALNLLGVVWMQMGQFEQAEGCLQRLLAREPHHVAALNNLGNLWQYRGEWSRAEGCYRQAQSQQPDHAPTCNNLGVMLQKQGRMAEAVAWYEKAIALQPGFANPWANLAGALPRLGRLNEAVDAARQALVLGHRDNPMTLNTLATLYQEQGDIPAALATFRRALAIAPGYGAAHGNLGQLLLERGELEPAADHLRQAWEADPNDGKALSARLQCLRRQCLWAELPLWEERQRASVLHHPERVIPPFTFLLTSDDPAEQARCARQWAAHALHPIRATRPPQWTFAPARRDRLHVGYLSGDLQTHAVAFLVAEVLERHDRERFRISAYSHGKDDGGAMRQRIQEGVDGFVDIRPLTMAQAARRIHDDGVDILVDLAGHTRGHRGGIIALRPAPVQVNWLGYPGTMGSDVVDYILADPFVIPQADFGHYSERVVWLPDTYQPNDRQRVLPPAPTRAALGLPETGLMFCCFNQCAKITPGVFDLWMTLLRELPEAALWLYADNDLAPVHLRQEAAQRGVAGERLIFAPPLPVAAHLARLQQADLFLDTFPYTAHTTASDALWAGVPVLTRVGNSFVSRVAGSLLAAMGVPELITRSPQEYLERALALARQPETLHALRQRIIATRFEAPLFDSARFTSNLEQAYTMMWERHAAGLPPAFIDVGRGR